MANLKIRLGKVVEVEGDGYKRINNEGDETFDGLRIKVVFDETFDFPRDDEEKTKNIPWVFPLLPKVFQSVPQVGEAVIVLYSDINEGQRFYIGPIISQPQFYEKCDFDKATSLLTPKALDPLEKISNNTNTTGSFPKIGDIAIVGRGKEDIILRYDKEETEGTKNITEKSEIQLRAGVRSKPTDEDNPNMIGNIIFNGIDPAFIQLKYKKGLATREHNEANSVINVVANRINLISNKDGDIDCMLRDQDDMISDEKMDDIMDLLHQVPMGDKLVELLTIMKDCIMHHVHPWSGMEQCGDKGGHIQRLSKYDINSILSEYVRIS